MNGLPYYKAYPRDFIEGTIGMDFETKGAYRLVLDLIYMQGGKLPDDAGYISGLLGCTKRKWNSLRQKLIDAGKLEVIGEFLSNYRADKELETSRKLQEKNRENAPKAHKNKDLASANAKLTRGLKPDTDNIYPLNPPLGEADKPPKKSANRKIEVAKPDDVDQSVWRDFLAIRKAKRAPITETGLNKIVREADKAGIDLNRALEVCCERGWQGFNAEWYNKTIPASEKKHLSAVERFGWA